jgi:ATP-dependent exoDNAse (exonuclease V) beta subunit
LGLSQPSIPSFNLNSAVDTLLKKEFDMHRSKGQRHPLMEKYGIDAVPMLHEDLDKWRHNFTGVQYLHTPTNLLIFGAVDDIWQNPQKELIVVDYKSTSKVGEIDLEDKWKQAYKRQMEIYQWLLRQNNYKVSSTGYFVYANGRTDLKAFDAKLEFDVTVLEYNGNDDWVEKAVRDAYKVLQSDKMPKYTDDCEYCNYRLAANSLENS